MTHDIRIDNDSNYPVNNERIQLPYSLFMLNPTRTIKQLLGQNITIISFTYSDVITNDENIIVDVKYTSIPISILKIYYIETSSLKHIMPNNEKYVATINGCNVKISLPNLDKDMKILPIRIKPTLSNNYSSSGQLNAQFAYYGIPVSINNCMNYLCTPLKYINHKYEPFQSEPVKPIYNESFKSEMLKHMQLDETIKELDEFSSLKPLISQVDTIDDVIVLNGSQDFEMVKDVGSVLEIADRYNVRDIKGTHAIGHTRFSTESGVDRYHAHPFQTYIVKDVSVVHNGQITNYWKVRDPLERKGHIFETFNDTECLVHYIADKLDSGYSLEEALEQSVEDMDGPFSYIIATPKGIGIAKDKLGLRPGVMAETDDIFAIASEEVSLREVVDTHNIEQISPGEVMVYEI